MAKLARIAPEVPALNLQSAIAFYEQQLGFEQASLAPQGDYAIVERDGVAIHLFEDRGRGSSPAGIHIFTHELAELFEEFEQRGVHFAQNIEPKPWGNRDFRVKDHFGNEIKFTEPMTADS
jgi:uncharacterized glyoxalase superfamily protein PhnB